MMMSKIFIIVLLIGMMMFSGCAAILLTPLIFVEGNISNEQQLDQEGIRR